MRKILLITLTMLMTISLLTACGGSGTKEESVKNNKAPTKSEKNEEIKGDGSLIPKSVIIEGVEYTKENKVGDLINDGWIIDTYKETDIIEEAKITLHKEEKEIKVDISFNDISTTPLKDSHISGIAVVNILGKNEMEFILSNGIALGESNKQVDKVYESVKDEIHTMTQNGVVKTKSMDYSNEEGMVLYSCYDDEEAKKDEMISVAVVWYEQ